MSLDGHFPRKRFGQHWLKDESILNEIIKSSYICSKDRVLEIGPGKGFLTEKLLRTDLNSLFAIELDKNLISGLEKKFSYDRRFSLVQGDFLSLSLLPPDGIPLNKVVANIPYNITGPILEKLLGRLGNYPEFFFQRLVILMQKEVADRILSKAGSTNFSALTVRINLVAKPTEICLVPPYCFTPPPKVTSKVVAFEPLQPSKRLHVDHENKIEQLLRLAFHSRRKKLKNTLLPLDTLENLQLIASAIGFSLDDRPQNISISQWVSLAERLLND